MDCFYLKLPLIIIAGKSFLVGARQFLVQHAAMQHSMLLLCYQHDVCLSVYNIVYVHAFVNSRIDYCNSFLYDVSDGLLRKLQAVQHAAARVVTGARKFGHITPVIHDLHWLPVCQRIKYKLAMIVYKCLHGLAPVYLVNDCQAVSAIASKRHLRSADTGTLFVPRTTTTLGMRSFAVAGPHIWNSLPTTL